MRFRLYIYGFIAFLSLNGSVAVAQENLTLYNMPAVQQCSYANPAFVPQSKINIGIPVLSSIYFNYGNSGFAVTDILQKGSDDSLHVNANNFLNTLHKTNLLTQSMQIDLLSFGLKLGKNYISFNVTEKENINFAFQKNFFSWVWNGNGAYLGQNMDFNFGLNIMHYREYAVGLSREITDKLTVGARLKYLYGMENVWAQDGNIVFNTASSDFGYTTSDNVRINTSGVDSASPFASKNGFNASNYLFGEKNGGMAIDLGATYKFNDRITFSASLIDLGYITWKNDITNYSSQGNFNFDGIDITQFISAGDSAINKLADSAKNTFNIKTTHQSYTNMLPAKIYLGANYKLGERSTAGIVLYGQFFNGVLYPGLDLAYTIKLTNWFSATGNYGIINSGYGNIGMGFAITGPVQWYVLTDNVVGFFLPQSVRTVNVRMGINLCFGRKPSEDESQF